jgi:hypothetical protein
MTLLKQFRDHYLQFVWQGKKKKKEEEEEESKV